MGTQHFRSLRAFKNMAAVPAAFSKADVTNSYLPFADPNGGPALSELVGRGDGIAASFSKQLQITAALAPSTVIVKVNGAQVAHDDGAGNFVADNGSGVTGTVSYAKGTVAVTCSSVPAPGVAVSVDCNQVAPLCQSQAIAFKVDSGNIDYSFDGTNVHGTVKSTDGYVYMLGVREREIYLRQNGGAAAARVWAW